jgi:DNA-binding LacI/PurR family transcriptional regulator
MRNDEDVDAVFCSSDLLALGVLSGLAAVPVITVATRSDLARRRHNALVLFNR